VLEALAAAELEDEGDDLLELELESSSPVSVASGAFVVVALDEPVEELDAPVGVPLPPLATALQILSLSSVASVYGSCQQLDSWSFCRCASN
jgi:hypothetical protein